MCGGTRAGTRVPELGDSGTLHPAAFRSSKHFQSMAPANSRPPERQTLVTRVQVARSSALRAPTVEAIATYGAAILALMAFDIYADDLRARVPASFQRLRATS